jgi:hypothetical protein
MPSLESRIAKLEESAPPENPAFHEFISRLPPLDAQGDLQWQALDPELHEVFTPWLIEYGKSHDWQYPHLSPLEVGMAATLFLFRDIDADPFMFERYRGFIPGRVIAAMYGRMRNYAWSAEVSLKVRQRAGVLDQDGEPLPGYTLLSNGCIVSSVRQGQIA